MEPLIAGACALVIFVLVWIAASLDGIAHSLRRIADREPTCPTCGALRGGETGEG